MMFNGDEEVLEDLIVVMFAYRCLGYKFMASQQSQPCLNPTQTH